MKKQSVQQFAHGGHREGAGRKPRMLRFRRLDGTILTPAQQRELETAMEQFGLVRVIRTGKAQEEK